MRLLNHQKTSSDESSNTVSVVVSLPPSRRGSRQTSRAGSPDRNSSDSGISNADKEDVEELMNVSDFKRRRAIVDALGWQPFTEWFYESTFRLESIQHLSHTRSGVGFPTSLQKIGVTHMLPQKQR